MVDCEVVNNLIYFLSHLPFQSFLDYDYWKGVSLGDRWERLREIMMRLLVRDDERDGRSWEMIDDKMRW